MLSEGQFDVAVVGAGTTGLVLASLLGTLNVRVVVIDPNKLVCQHPRASHVDDETMRLIQTLGMAEAEKGYLVRGGFEVLDTSGKRLFAWDMVEGLTDQAWRSNYQFFQPDFEAVLRGKLAMTPSVELHLGWQVDGVSTSSNGVHLKLRNRETGRGQVVDAAYVVGCDGANSFIRKHLPGGIEDFDGTRRSLIVDVVKFTSATGLSDVDSFLIAGPRPVTHVPIVSPISRFQFMLLGDEDAEAFEDPNTIYGLLEEWMRPDSYRIMRSDVYTWDAQLVKGWRAGRLLIAGDAAHVMPPMLGQGMCSGLRDAANLAWKLARVTAGQAHESLLDSYEAERAPHVRKMILESTRQANTVAEVGRGRMADIPAAGETVDRKHMPIEPALAMRQYPLAGELSRQPILVTGSLMDDLVGYAFAVLAHESVLQSVSVETRRRWADMGCVVIPASEPNMSAWLDEANVAAIIVRPDRYVLAGVVDSEQLDTATTEVHRLVTSEGGAK